MASKNIHSLTVVTRAFRKPILMFLFQIVHRYDIILIQEVRDSDLTATKKLIEHVNK